MRLDMWRAEFQKDPSFSRFNTLLMRILLNFLARWTRRNRREPLSSRHHGLEHNVEAGHEGLKDAAPEAQVRGLSEYHEILQLAKEKIQCPASATPFSSRAETLAALAQVDFIPALPTAASSLREMFVRPDVCLEEILAALSRDAALSLCTVRAANLQTPSLRPEGIETAVQLLGVRRVQLVVLQHAEFHENARSESSLDWRPLWIHSLAVGRIASKLSELLHIGNPSKLYFAGLWHDIGKLVRAYDFPKAYREILSLASVEATSLEECERRQLGISHSEAGMLYADRCGVGALVLEAILHHATPENAQLERGGTAIVHIANFVANKEGLGFSGNCQTTTDRPDMPLRNLTAWTVLMAETGRQQDVENLLQTLQPFLKSLAADLQALKEGF